MGPADEMRSDISALEDFLERYALYLLTETVISRAPGVYYHMHLVHPALCNVICSNFQCLCSVNVLVYVNYPRFYLPVLGFNFFVALRMRIAYIYVEQIMTSLRPGSNGWRAVTARLQVRQEL